ncbi:hypothetical protein ACYPKM_04930 [Pseudomonas aeruginosa]
MSKALDAIDYRDTHFYLYEVLESKDKSNSTFSGSVSTSWDGRPTGVNIHEHKTHSHMGWVRNLEVGGEEKYAGYGHANFRPGHVLGCAAWRGRWVGEYNLTTNTYLRIRGIPTEHHLVSALIQAFMLVTFGWFMLPFVFFVLLLGAEKRGSLQFCINTNKFHPFPGMLTPEIRCYFMDVLTFCVMVYYWFKAAEASSGPMFLWVTVIAFVVATITHYRTLGSISRAYESFVAYSRQQILDRYAKVKEKAAAKATTAA